MGWILFIGAGMISWALCHPIGRWLRKHKVWDRPNSRSSHEMPVLRGGGLAPLVVVVLALGVWVCSSEPGFGVAWLWAVLLLGYVSFRDDQGGVTIQRRLAVQIFVSVGVLFAMAGGTLPACLGCFRPCRLHELYKFHGWHKWTRAGPANIDVGRFSLALWDS